MTAPVAHTSRADRFLARVDAALPAMTPAEQRKFLYHLTAGWEERYRDFIRTDGKSEHYTNPRDPVSAADFTLTLAGLAARRRRCPAKRGRAGQGKARNMTERLGIYFDLDEDTYHQDLALGSTDLRRLLSSGPDFWWQSGLNPNPPERKESPALNFGRALHKLVLEGSQAFAVRYVRRPDDLARLDAKSKAKLCPNNETVLDGDDFDRIKVSGELIAKNPDLAAAFEGGVPEVSVFWEHTLDDGFVVRCKARFDYLKIRGVGDLKSIRNYMGRPFAEACGRSIVEYRYDIQAAHYLEGRAEVRRMVEDGLVFGDHDPAWLRRAADCEQFAFQWVFFQAEGAPITWSRSLSPGNPILDIAERDRGKALLIYRDFKQAFPDGDMWLLNEPVTEIDINELPAWFR